MDHIKFKLSVLKFNDSRDIWQNKCIYRIYTAFSIFKSNATTHMKLPSGGQWIYCTSNLFQRQEQSLFALIIARIQSPVLLLRL